MGRPPNEGDYETSDREWVSQNFIAVIITISFLVSSLLNPYLVYFYHHNKITNLGHLFYQIISLSNFITLLWYGPYYIWWICQPGLPTLTQLDGYGSALVLTLVMISSTTTVYLSGAKLLALRFPFYVMTQRVKWALKGSLSVIVLLLVFFPFYGVAVSEECFRSYLNFFPLVIMAVNTTSGEVDCFNRMVHKIAIRHRIRGGKLRKAEWFGNIVRPHLYVYFVNAVLGLIVSGMVMWQVRNIRKGMRKEHRKHEKNGVVTILLLNLGNAANAVFCAVDMFLKVDIEAHVLAGLFTLIFFPMVLCSFNPLVVIVRGSKVKEEMKVSWMKVKRSTVRALRLSTSST